MIYDVYYCTEQQVPSRLEFSPNENSPIPDASQIDKYLIRPNQNTVGGGGAGSKIFLCSVRAQTDQPVLRPSSTPTYSVVVVYRVTLDTSTTEIIRKMWHLSGYL